MCRQTLQGFNDDLQAKGGAREGAYTQLLAGSLAAPFH